MAKVNRSKYKNSEWTLKESEKGDGLINTSEASLSVLMDIRDELQKLNWLLSCPNFQEVPSLLRGIRVNTRKPVKRKPKARKNGE